jgi:polysaccharide deacetylase 2 family uncharacterized protein YibQ
MPKREKNNPKKSLNFLIYTAWALAFVATVLSSFVIGYYIGSDNIKDEMIKKERVKEKKRLALLQQLENSTIKEEKTDVNNKLKEILKKDAKITAKKSIKVIDASHEYDISNLPKSQKREIKITSTKPKLAIIIDDVSVKSHVEAIKELNLPLSMSFLPPSKHRPNSHTLAAKEEFYMVHLPMEAKNFTKEEPFTLKVDDSQKEITKRIKMIKKLFPKVRYINNHTGSKFTSNELAVNKLIYALKKQNIDFIDSRTIGSTKVQKVMRNYGEKYIARDVFLDHKSSKSYVKKQIRQAIKIAKLHGTAIAIGHPHTNTLLAIKESKELFNDVELVLINRLF